MIRSQAMSKRFDHHTEEIPAKASAWVQNEGS